LKKNSLNIWHKINPILGFIAMFVTQDVVLRFFFRKKKILKNGFSIPINSSIILAPTHRSRWDGLILTMAMGRRVTKKDCRFMVTKSEMRGLQGWFLKRLGCFSINQLSPSLSTMKYAIDLIEKGEQLVVFPEGKINKYGKKLVLKEGLYRLARLATKKTNSIIIIPIGIAYSKIPPNFRSEFCLSFGKPIPINNYSNFTIKDFNKFLNEKMTQEEEKALKNIGRWICNKLLWILIIEKENEILKIIPILFIFFGNVPYKNEVHAEIKNPEDFRALSNESKKLSISNVKYFIKEGDNYIKNGDFEKAKDFYLDARKLAKQLASFYSDLNSSFKGIDARIPKEMQRKGKQTLQILAESNERLASMYIKTEKPEVAVPLLVETIRIMSPNSTEGKEAYERLIQLGFVETKYKG